MSTKIEYTDNISTLSHLGQNKIAQPSDTVDIIPVNISRGKVRKVVLNGVEGPVGARRVEGVGVTDGFLHLGGLQGPDLQGVVHAAGHDVATLQVDVLTDIKRKKTLQSTIQFVKKQINRL